MNKQEIKKALELLKDRIERHETIIAPSGGQYLTVHWSAGGQKLFTRLDQVEDQVRCRTWTCSYNGQSVDVTAATEMEAKEKSLDQLSVGVRGFLDLDAIEAE